MNLLAGDIGGTKVRLALFSRDGSNSLKKHRSNQYESKKYSNFYEIVSEFLTECPEKVDAACFGVAGPVADGAVKATNLPWELSEINLCASLGISHVRLVNDLVATAAIVSHLKSDDTLLLYPGKPNGERPMSVVIAPGTGLGQAMVHHRKEGMEVFSSEGGHADYAPTNDDEIALLAYLKSKLKRVSVERLLAGPGIVNIYNFLKDTKREVESPDTASRFETENPSAVISQEGLRGEDRLSKRTMDMFVSILGSHCGNMVLTYMATGGVYLGGGIPPKIESKLTEPGFLQAYLSKGRLSPLVEATPVHLIRDDYAALTGAAWIACELL